MNTNNLDLVFIIQAVELTAGTSKRGRVNYLENRSTKRNFEFRMQGRNNHLENGMGKHFRAAMRDSQAKHPSAPSVEISTTIPKSSGKLNYAVVSLTVRDIFFTLIKTVGNHNL